MGELGSSQCLEVAIIKNSEIKSITGKFAYI